MALTPNHHTDEQLLTLLRSTDQREYGFRQLMQQYQQSVYRHVRRMLTQHEDTNDVLQNTFIKVYRGIDNFEGRSSLSTWIYRIATNEALTFLDNQKRRITISLDDDSRPISIKAESNQSLGSDDIVGRLTSAIHTLPHKQKVVFNLRYYDDMPYDQMSEILNTSVGALKASYHQAAKKVETFLRNTTIH